MRNRYWLLFALIPLASILSVVMIPRLKAETHSGQQATPKAMAELIETLKIWKLINAVSPTPEQSVPLLTRFNELENLKTQYRKEHRQAIKTLKSLKAAEIDSAESRAKLQAALSHYHNLETNFVQRRQAVKEEINQILTLEQQVKFEVFSYTYRQDLKKTLQTLIELQKNGK